MLEHHLARDVPDGLLGAADFAPHGVLRPQQLVDQRVRPVGRVVVDHVQFLDHHLALLLDALALEQRVAKDVHQKIEALFEVRLSHLAPVDRQLMLGARVDDPARALHGRADLHRRGPALGALEEHMLYEVGNPGPLVRLIPRAYAHVDVDADRARERHFASRHAQAVGQGGLPKGVGVGDGLLIHAKIVTARFSASQCGPGASWGQPTPRLAVGLRPHPHPRALLLYLRHRARGQPSPAPVLPLNVTLLHRVAKLHRHPQPPGHLGRQPHVLSREVELETRLEVPANSPFGIPRIERVSPVLREMASNSISGGAPAFTPSVNASDRSTPRLSPMKLLMILQMAPEPCGPQYIVWFPISASTDAYLSYTSLSPPTMMHSVPSSAPTVPPLTGASSTLTPRASACAAMREMVSGSVVLKSNSALPEPRRSVCRPPQRPPPPRPAASAAT